MACVKGLTLILKESFSMSQQPPQGYGQQPYPQQPPPGYGQQPYPQQSLPYDDPTCYHHSRFPCPRCGHRPTYTPQVSSGEANAFKNARVVAVISALTIIGLPIAWGIMTFYLRPHNGPLEMRAQIKKCPACGYIWTQPKMSGF